MNGLPISISEPLSSLEELGRPLVDVLKRIEGDQELADRYQLGALFGSRGSYPFLRALQHVTAEGGPRSGVEFNIVPHIFSLENLLGIISQGDNYGHDAYKNILEVIYADIAPKLTKKIGAICYINPLDEEHRTVLLDVDEVNTGANLTERVKIYNKLDLPQTLPFYIASFVGSMGQQREVKHYRSFDRARKRSPDTYHYLDITATDPISWSDHEAFFVEAGLVYPGIAVPELVTLRNMLRREDHPVFYLHFFRRAGEELAKRIGEEGTLMYKLVQLPDDRAMRAFGDEEVILETSAAAYEATVREFEELGRLRHGYKPLKGGLEIDLERGCVVGEKPNGSERILLQRAYPGIVAHGTFRNPFVLAYSRNSVVSDTISTMMDKFLGHFNNNGHAPSEPAPSR